MIDKNKIKEAKIKEPVKNEFYELLKSKFPQTINSDGAVNFDAIKMLLDIKVKENIKGYELNWIGKGLANALYNTPCDKELKFNETKSKNTDTTQNIIIKGDNLDALKILKSAYYEKIKMIYIDPPYNTKNDDFIYPDDFRKDYKQICIETGLIKIEIDEFGNKTEVPSEAMNFFTSVTSTKSHSGWLSFMLPRLKLARDLLKDDGVIFISIDNNEQANLKLLCDEIFGEENFIETFLWKKTETPPSASNKTRKTHEFILCYQKEINNEKFAAKFAEGGDAPLWNETNSERILEFPENYVNSTLPDGFYKKGVRDKIELLDDVEVKNSKIINSFRLKSHFRWKQETLNKEIENNVNLIVKSNKFSIRYCREDERIVMPTNEISKKDNVGTNETASKELLNLFNNQKIFNFNKPISLIQYLIQLSTGIGDENGDDIILDFFAGSGTTAHAVMAQNAIDGGNRKFILVQLDEKIDEKKSKTAFDFCKNELGSKEPIISDITIERVKRAGNKLEKPNLDTGFCVYDLTDKDTLIQKSDGTLDLYLNRDLTPLDKALNLALQSGKTVDIKSEEICKDKLYKFDDSYYIVSYDKNVIESLEATTDKPVYISGYNDIKLDDFLNLQSVLKDRLNVVY
ncbi:MULTISPECIES: site-specific DNA-methyltransferase [Campylobacter]|uniref:site-specific DNA-methyltransferase n=1 Tax=Campylobacter TaxID=194 RepID=UPI000A342812|nr:MULTISPECIES: site-specific DNA-methyltransferase [unclassified Campylobacter]MBE6430679.1 site-specific DNA-methyltransferase [Campylobacter sp.]